ncbi:MAG: cation:proton antiporter [Rubrivivax sp.]|jgi:Kef-type K+ transport system membrane component KefB|nr:cation:proton antiporter [Rubrivivax sp.]
MDAWTWPHPPGPPGEVVWLAAVLLAGALMGEAIARTTRWPRVLGYTLAGAGAAAAGLHLSLPLPDTARWVIDLALALLLFEIGTRVRLRWLRHNPGLLATSLLEATGTAAAVYAVLWLLDLPPAVAASAAVLAVPASAAVAGRVALELGADGQVTQRMTHLTALNTLYAVLAFIVLKLVLLADGEPGWWQAVGALAVSSAGALVLAAALALAVARVARRMDLLNESAVLLLLGLVLLAVGVARWLGFSTLLVPLLAGLMLRNTTERPWVWPRHFGTAGGVLVLLLFVYLGALWSPGLLAAGGVAALALVLARSLAKGAAVLLLGRWSGSSARQALALSITLTPLSAAALVMLGELWLALPAVAVQVAPVLLTALVVLELLGPIAVQLALRLAGELPPAPPETR